MQATIRKDMVIKIFLKGDNFSNHIRFDNYNDYIFYGKYPMAKYDYKSDKKQFSTKSKRAKFKIKSPKIIKIKGNRLVLKKIENKVKYIIQFSTERNFRKANKILTKKTKVKILKLKKNKKYFIRYRALKKMQGKQYIQNGQIEWISWFHKRCK